MVFWILQYCALLLSYPMFEESEGRIIAARQILGLDTPILSREGSVDQRRPLSDDYFSPVRPPKPAYSPIRLISPSRPKYPTLGPSWRYSSGMPIQPFDRGGSVESSVRLRRNTWVAGRTEPLIQHSAAYKAIEDSIPHSSDQVSWPNLPNLPKQDTPKDMRHCRIRAMVRIRPLNDREKGGSVLAEEGGNVIRMEHARRTKTFRFDSVFPGSADQNQVFDECGVKGLLQSAVEGYQCCLFAYGQTGSGKTYSLCGDSENTAGIIPRSLPYLYQLIEALPPEQREQTVVKAGYLEIYNEKPRDLLTVGTSTLTVRSNRHGFFVENQSVVRCQSKEDLLAVFREGERNREFGRHQLNINSSRSHCLFSVSVERQVSGITHFGKVTFVDLAGSEKLKMSQQSSKKGLRETANINRSLHSLGKVIGQLASHQRLNYVCFRDSVLTKLLMDSLGGSAMAIMLACVSPAQDCLSDTLSTLHYASLTKHIQSQPKVQCDPRDRLLKKLMDEVGRLQRENAQLRAAQSMTRPPGEIISATSNTPGHFPQLLDHDFSL